MKRLIEQEQKSIKDIWDKQLYIPVYQRAFVWEDVQLENAVRTVFDDYNSGIESYMGNILITDKIKDDQELIEVVDGQQRMTFNFLMLISIHELLQEAEVIIEDAEWKMDWIEENKTKIRNMLILSKDERINGHMPRLYYVSKKLNLNILEVIKKVVDSSSTKDRRFGIVKAQEKVKALIATKNESRKEYSIPNTTIELKNFVKVLNKLFEYVTNSVKFIEIKLKDDKYATEIFERMNSTSKPLNDYELFKNYVAGQLIDQKETDIDTKILEFDEMVNDQNFKLDSGIIIRSLLYNQLGKIPAGKYKFDELKKSFKKSGDASDMYKLVLNTIQSYSYLEKGNFEESYTALPWKVISTYNFKQIKPLFISLINKFGESEELAELFMILISIMFKRIVFKGEVANAVESMLTVIANDNGVLLAPSEIIKKLKQHKMYQTSSEGFTQSQFDGIQKQEFIKVLWLYAINSKFGNIDILVSSANTDIAIKDKNLEIEHIAPRSWKKNWSKVFEGMDDSEIDNIIESPGNKMPLLGKYNKSASNKDFLTKKLENYVLSSFGKIDFDEVDSKDKWVFIDIDEINIKDVMESQEWTKEKILSRSKKLKKFFENELNKYL